MPIIEIDALLLNNYISDINSRYKSVADSEDFGLLITVCSCYRKLQLTGIAEIVKTNAPVHEICGRKYIDSTKLICSL
jgi:hypothetical protein